MSRRAGIILSCFMFPFAALAAVYTTSTLAADPITSRASQANPNAESTATPTATTVTTPNPVCGMGWNIAYNNSVGASDGELYGISALSPTDVWAVGSNPDGIGRTTTIMHWDGQNWSTSPGPMLNTTTAELFGIDALAADNAWAVGYTDNHALILHWNGVVWRTAPESDSLQNTRLYGVSIAGAYDAWAVGWKNVDGVNQPITMHWDGANWSAVPTPGVVSDGVLSAVSARANNDVWAVGHYGSPRQTLVQHWNGTEWNLVPSPNAAGFGNNELRGVVAIRPNDAWSVGYYSNPATGAMQALTLHWDGSQWNSVPNPAGPGSPGFLYGVTASSPDNVWAVGGISGEASPNLTMRWDGTSWTQVMSPAAIGGNQYLATVSAVTGGDIWAAGHFSGSAPSGELILRYFDHCAMAGALSGHVTWQGPPAQPHPLQQLPMAITFSLEGSTMTLPVVSTGPTGYFTIAAGSLPQGTYNWRAIGSKYLANAGYVTMGGQSVTLEMGLMRVGDSNGDNIINIYDFGIVKHKFGKHFGDPGFDAQADFDRNETVNIADFMLQRPNFGQMGAPLLGENP